MISISIRAGSAIWRQKCAALDPCLRFAIVVFMALLTPNVHAQHPSPANGPQPGTTDWPMWGGAQERNLVSPATGIFFDFDPETKKHILWTAKLGSITYASPVVAAGKVFIGTNNAAGYRPQHQGDRGILLCFDAITGKFLWQLTRPKLPQGRANDSPAQGIASTPCVEGNRLWVMTNRAELMCLDVNGFYDGKNDGPYTDETDTGQQDADIVWSLDLIGKLGVYPQRLAASSPVVRGDLLYVVTSNGLDEWQLNVPAPEAPSFIAVNKHTGAVVWQDSSPATASKAPPPFNTIFQGQWSSPAIGIVHGKAQVYMPGGDGCLYAFDAVEHNGRRPKLLWWFDVNQGAGAAVVGAGRSLNGIVATPVFDDNSVVIAVGQEPGHGDGVGQLFRIDATKQGDVTQRGLLWHCGGPGPNGDFLFRRTISTVAIHRGLVYAANLGGFIQCLDFQTGKPYWEHDMLAAVWGSPLVVDGKVLLGDEDGDITILAEGRAKKVIRDVNLGSAIYSTPTAANGVLYIASQKTLFAIGAR